MTKKLTFLLIVGCAISVPSTVWANGNILFTSFGPGQSYNTGDDDNSSNHVGDYVGGAARYVQLMPFKASFTGNVDSVDFAAFSFQTTDSITVNLRIVSGLGTNPSDAPVVDTLGSVEVTIQNIYKVNSTTHNQLTVGQQYYLLMEVVADGRDLEWSFNNRGIMGNNTSGNGPVPWSSISGYYNTDSNTPLSAFDVLATPTTTPEPAFYGVLGVAISGLFVAVRRTRTV